MAADKAYSSRNNRTYLRKRGIRRAVPEKASQIANRRNKGSRGGRPVAYDAALYKDRNTVERCINKIKGWRGLATRYDKTPESYEAACTYAAPQSGYAASTPQHDPNSMQALAHLKTSDRQRLGYRVAKKAAVFRASGTGCSVAAKWPPAGMGHQHRTS